MSHRMSTESGYVEMLYRCKVEMFLSAYGLYLIRGIKKILYLQKIKS